jgi:GalNAc-alpha-(1->4)-GalNAc-alpha-(1->3)-diNAcBac-PP-undecaprenol alpha-1,4-N-acetyl-D-galactosaminyltransferase
LKQKELKITLVLPALNMGGMERVMAELACYFSTKPGVEVTLVLLSNQPRFYILADSVKVIEPDFDYNKYSRLVFTIKLFRYLQRSLKKSRPDVLLSFSERYNAFVILAAIGRGAKVYVSDRASPFYSAGKMIDLINPYAYRFATGIIAQTNLAKEHLLKKTKHKNIVVIGNPIRSFQARKAPKENIILYVGRFSDQKNQHVLVEHFAAINDKNWVVKLVGDGFKEKQTREKVQELGVSESVHFEGRQKNIDDYYYRSSIFAFTSLSEGFPNALGEAMAAGLACISYDCIAGPADLIDDGINGFLIPVGDHALYTEKLKELMAKPELRASFGHKAKEKIKSFESHVISEKYFQFLICGTK